MIKLCEKIVLCILIILCLWIMYLLHKDTKKLADNSTAFIEAIYSSQVYDTSN